MLGPPVAAFAGVREREEGAFLDALLLLLLFVGSGDGALTGEMEGGARTWFADALLGLPPFFTEAMRARRWATYSGLWPQR